jgi:hypothetical protein
VGGNSANQISLACNSVEEGYFSSRFRPIRFLHIAVSMNLPNQSGSKKNLSTKVTVRIYIICIEYFLLFLVEKILARIKSQLEFILFLVKKSLININCLLACLLD